MGNRWKQSERTSRQVRVSEEQVTRNRRRVTFQNKTGSHQTKPHHSMMERIWKKKMENAWMDLKPATFKHIFKSPLHRNQSKCSPVLVNYGCHPCK